MCEQRQCVHVKCVFLVCQVTCFDWDADGGHDVIGQFSTSLAELVSAHSSHSKLQWECINPEKAKKKKKYKNSGTVYAEVKVRSSNSPRAW